MSINIADSIILIIPIIPKHIPFRDVTYTLSIEKLKRDNLYIPQISLIEGMKKSYKWYSDNNIKISDSKMNMIEACVSN